MVDCFINHIFMYVHMYGVVGSRCLKTLEGPQNSPVDSLSFDLSGQYLAAGGNGICVWVVKEWNVVTQQTSHTDRVTGLKFGSPTSSFLASTSLDRSLKIYSAPQ